MEDYVKKDRDVVYTKVVRAGKRTYFFDANAMKSGELYITVAESKKRVDVDGKIFYEKHKLFLYKEDFDKFENALSSIIHFIRTGEKIEDDFEQNFIEEDNSFSIDESSEI